MKCSKNNNKIMTTNPEENQTKQSKAKKSETAISMKMVNLLLRYETTNYASHSPSKIIVLNGTKRCCWKCTCDRRIILVCLFFMHRKKCTLRCRIATLCSALQIINFSLYENDAANWHSGHFKVFSLLYIS